MALSSAQQNKIVQLLGYPGKTLDAGSVVYDKVLADRLTGLNTDAEALVVVYLNSIADIEDQMSAAPARFISKKVGDIELNNDEMRLLRKERRRQIRELAQLVNIDALGMSGANVMV
jgi:hypothetical protein